MICHNSVGYDAQIKDLLIKSAFNMDEKEIDACYDKNSENCLKI